MYLHLIPPGMTFILKHMFVGHAIQLDFGKSYESDGHRYQQHHFTKSSQLLGFSTSSDQNQWGRCYNHELMQLHTGKGQGPFMSCTAG